MSRQGDALADRLAQAESKLRAMEASLSALASAYRDLAEGSSKNSRAVLHLCAALDRLLGIDSTRPARDELTRPH